MFLERSLYQANRFWRELVVPPLRMSCPPDTVVEISDIYTVWISRYSRLNVFGKIAVPGEPLLAGTCRATSSEENRFWRELVVPPLRRSGAPDTVVESSDIYTVWISRYSRLNVFGKTAVSGEPLLAGTCRATSSEVISSSYNGRNFRDLHRLDLEIFPIECFSKDRCIRRTAFGGNLSSHLFVGHMLLIEWYPESRLAKLFNGSIPIVLDSLKQHYFIDRDGGMFRHILNFMRNSRLLIPDNFADLDLLLEEARYFDIAPMCRQLEQMKKERIKNGSTATMTMSSSSPSPPPTNQLGNRGTGCTTMPCNRDSDKIRANEGNCNYECVALHVSPDLGERVMLSGGRALLDEVFPETTQAVIDARSGVAWHQQDTRHVIRFPLNGYELRTGDYQASERGISRGSQQWRRRGRTTILGVSIRSTGHQYLTEHRSSAEDQLEDDPLHTT
ncbi:BTB/POZ domain-containing protein KCTD15 [Melipona quadrifasciata]|uniref:BTB/POZ domain-containing protein KCTD15 n=1 Tax=Melipona quadrifasciata TaxID=166423 RepID=A0A0M8ZXD5_9HYME|nr:BTB/POZ domain-containing protein KCTD15 [Melipona quadrifasciata]